MESERTTGQCAAIFKQFIDAIAAEASSPSSPLLDRIRAHLDAEPAQLPVIAEEYDPFEHPNLQVALDDYVARDGRKADLVGVAAANKRFMGWNLSDLMSWGPNMPGRSVLAEGPVDYVNFHLAHDQVLFLCPVRPLSNQRRLRATGRLRDRSLGPGRSADAGTPRSDGHSTGGLPGVPPRDRGVNARPERVSRARHLPVAGAVRDGSANAGAVSCSPVCRQRRHRATCWSRRTR